MRSLAPGSRISVVIPCFNEAGVLSELFARVETAASGWGLDYEVVLVDDGSTDTTWADLCALHGRNARWKAIRLSRNYGHQVALWTGMEHTRGNVVAILDADLQDPPEVVGDFLAKWREGFDVVYAIRQQRKENAFKRMAYMIFYRILAGLSEVKIPLDTGDFCLMDRRVINAILQSREQEPFVRGLRAWVGFRQVGIPCERQARAAGEPKYTFRKLVRLALSGILGFSARPLRLATYLGFAVSTLSAVGVVFTLLQRLYSEEFKKIGLEPVPGYATIVISILFLGGVQLICLGILGEYVGRIFENVKGRPRSIVAESAGFPEPGAG